MTTLYYCMGGGLGHITRFVAFCHTTSINPVLLTNCKAVKTGMIKTPASRVIFPDDSDQLNQENLRNWIKIILQKEKPKKLIIDAFPGGILGELCNINELQYIECQYLARILDLKQYCRRIDSNLPRFSTIYRLETLHDEHENFLNSMSLTPRNLTLVDPPMPASETSLMLPPKAFWAIIHSGTEEEILQLWQFARQTAECENTNPELLFVTPGAKPSCLTSEVRHLSVYPAHTVINRAERVFSAAGFNIMRQMRNYRARHAVMPFKRALDDQFFRARTCLKVSTFAQ